LKGKSGVTSADLLSGLPSDDSSDSDTLPVVEDVAGEESDNDPSFEAYTLKVHTLESSAKKE